MRILVTGSEGLIGRDFCVRIAARGWSADGFDLRSAMPRDIRDRDTVRRALATVDGVVHLAAVARVADGEKDPDYCQAVNVSALADLIDDVVAMNSRPWIVFASSREVYGRVATLPVSESAPVAPMNVYARTKAEGERLIQNARKAGVIANIGRFATVYGRTSDYPDRLIPAFARAAARGGELRIDGPETTVDATHVDDVVRGLETLTEVTASRELLPPVHFASGIGTTIAELAIMAQSLAARPVATRTVGAPAHDVGKFIGDPTRCRALLGWESHVPVAVGFARLVRDFALGSRTNRQA